MSRRCVICGRGDEGRPMIYRGESACSGRCRQLAVRVRENGWLARAAA